MGIVKRGDVVTVVLPRAYGKPRPALIIQTNTLEGLASVIIIPITSKITDLSIRPILTPNNVNGLQKLSQVMVDKMGAIPRDKIGGLIGRLEVKQIREIEQQLLVTLGIA